MSRIVTSNPIYLYCPYCNAQFVGFSCAASWCPFCKSSWDDIVLRTIHKRYGNPNRAYRLIERFSRLRREISLYGFHYLDERNKAKDIQAEIP